MEIHIEPTSDSSIKQLTSFLNNSNIGIFIINSKHTLYNESIEKFYKDIEPNRLIPNGALNIEEKSINI